VGDSIGWSEYSLGERELPSVRVIGEELRSSDDPFRGRRRYLDIQVENNRITRISRTRDPDRSTNVNRIAYKAFVDGVPYMIWPDDKFVSF
jgi:hypothetical protein